MASQQIYAAPRPAILHDPARAHDQAVAAQGFATAQMWWVMAGSLLAFAVLMHRAGLSVALWSSSNIPYLAAAGLVAAVRAGWIGANLPQAHALRDCAGYYALFTAMALTGAAASYPIAALTHGYADQTLARSDAALGFDWVAWYRTVADHRILQLLGTAAYQSIYLTPAILLGRFALTGQRREAHRFLGSFWLAAVITLALFSLMPAVGPFSYLWHGPIRYMPSSELWQPDLIPALRAGTFHTIDLSELRGLVSAPSFHAAAGALYLRAAWRAGPARWPLVWVVGAMLLATPVEGTHYLTDMIVGMGVAVLAMAVIDALLVREVPAA
ncbi:MAG: phosphatase PAP2 family protein [Candidatus Andeanibacterium colombiense]|uniref:Phosphatase PAP2 family protein n=1 Tax=Candidatus Andeanibacterium colombiense TaxID=3121345 RepID=A0AAJ5X9R2_9SPHN|nr:MAG: phosphatase PAP2 family protein [Sphingomonadaceae bacterium]